MAAEDIRDAVERQAKAVTLRPSIGQNTAVTRISLRDGLTCDISEGSWQLVASMSPKYGGANDGPNPGVFGRAALGSCLVIGYAIWAARLGIAVDALDVEVHADYDARGELGVSDDISPGYVRIRYVVTVSSPASEDDIRRWLDTADRYSSWRDTIARAVPIERELHVTSTSR